MEQRRTGHTWLVNVMRARHSSLLLSCTCCLGLALACQDAAGWDNRRGKTCADYAEFCADGKFLPGKFAWVGGAAFNSPEAACCVCGGGVAAAVAAAPAVEEVPAAELLANAPAAARAAALARLERCDARAARLTSPAEVLVYYARLPRTGNGFMCRLLGRCSAIDETARSRARGGLASWFVPQSAPAAPALGRDVCGPAPGEDVGLSYVPMQAARAAAKKAGAGGAAAAKKAGAGGAAGQPPAAVVGAPDGSPAANASGLELPEAACRATKMGLRFYGSEQQAPSAFGRCAGLNGTTASCTSFGGDMARACGASTGTFHFGGSASLSEVDIIRGTLLTCRPAAQPEAARRRADGDGALPRPRGRAVRAAAPLATDTRGQAARTATGPWRARAVCIHLRAGVLRLPLQVRRRAPERLQEWAAEMT